MDTYLSGDEHADRKRHQAEQRYPWDASIALLHGVSGYIADVDIDISLADMDKHHLRGQLQTIKNNYALVQLSIGLIAQPDALQTFEKTLEVVKHDPEVETFAYIRYVFDNDELLKHATGQFRQSVMRNCLKEMFELVKAYGEVHGHADVIRRAPWYGFLRVVRNCLSHDLRLHFNPYDLKQLPVSWAGLTIDASIQDQPLAVRDFLSRQRVVALMDDVIKYVEDHVG